MFAIYPIEASEDLGNAISIFVADDDRYVGVRVGDEKIDLGTIYFFVGENILFGRDVFVDLLKRDVIHENGVVQVRVEVVVDIVFDAHVEKLRKSFV